MKKWILIILVATCAVFCALGLAACVPADLQNHVWSDWKYDYNNHWRECTVERCNLTKDKGEHEWETMDNTNNPDYRAPTCSRTGRGWVKCTICEVEAVGNIPTTDHDWELVEADSKAATCNEAGSDKYECKDCHTIKTEVVPATGVHTYDGDKWEITAAGHKPVCDVCGQSGEFEEHDEEQTKYDEPEGLNDGTEELTCKVCHNARTVNVVNPDVPDKLDVKISHPSDSVQMEDYYIDGTYFGKKVKLKPAGTGSTYRYNLEFTVTYPDGSTSTNVRSLTRDESSEGGVRAYYRDDNMNETWLDVSYNGEKFIYGGLSTIDGLDGYSPVFRVINPGNYCVIFKYETGTKGKAENRVRATFVLFIECTNAKSASASAVAVGGIDDGLVCLSTGAYEGKSY